MGNRDVIAIGTSAGGVEALIHLARNFPPDLPASVLVTIHLSSYHRSALDEILTRAGPLPAHFATEGQPYRKGHIYIAPHDRHLLVEGERLALGSGPRENNSRPAIDPMLRSVAACCGARAVGVVMTGTLGDGASGLWAVQQCSGMTVVQDPHDAAFAEMPLTALTRVHPDHVTPLAEMPRLLASLARQPAGEQVPIPQTIAFEADIARGGHATMDDMDDLGRRSVLACPDCHGVMWEIDEGELVRYRCHVGHAYTAELMSVALDGSLRRALASALRALEERLALARKLQHQAERQHHPLLADNWSRKASEFQQELEIIRDAVRRMDVIAQSQPAEPKQSETV
jgi:two-component system chemotaxis response regulator CheB